MAEFPGEDIELNECPDREEGVVEEEKDQQNDEETSFVDSLVSPIFNPGKLIDGTEVNIFAEQKSEITSQQNKNAKRSILKAVFQLSPHEKFGPFNQDLLKRPTLRIGERGRFTVLNLKTLRENAYLLL